MCSLILIYLLILLKIINMKKLFLNLLVIFICSVVSSAQTAPTKYWIKFKDKNNSPYSISIPAAFLSSKSIERRIKQGITIQENDLPVNSWYIDSVQNTGAKVLTKSKWFNAVTISTTDTSVINKIMKFPFVVNVEKVTKYKKKNIEKDIDIDFSENNAKKNEEKKDQKDLSTSQEYHYGKGKNQIEMLGGIYMHNHGYRGEGMTIAVIDGGFYKVDKLSIFDSLWINKQILGYKDFVSPNGNVFNEATHGMSVLSTMGGNLPGQLVGTAPKANYWLLRSEDTNSEFPVEEDNWVAAAEFADSVGVDVINSSLGYTEFDNGYLSHTYADMNGNTCRVTIGADLAVSKGMIVVNSAGNSGNDNWKYIGAPADGDSVLTIGAVDPTGDYAAFSSIGPSHDGRVKPDVVAQGLNTYVVSSNGSVYTSNGTSFSSPVMAGMVACLWQANPNKKNTEILDAIRKSASQYNEPDIYLGYGIPNFPVANKILSEFNTCCKPSENSFNLFPNPFTNDLIVVLNVMNNDKANIELIDIKGKLVFSQENFILHKGCNYIILDTLNKISKGSYIVRIRTFVNGNSFSHKVIKS